MGMEVNVKKKLVELLASVPPVPALIERGSEKGQTVAEYYADHLIANGTIVFPCKVGDTIFEVDPEHGVVKHEIYEVCVVYKTTATDDNGSVWDDFYTSDDIDTAYKTRQEAEANFYSYGERKGDDNA